MTLEERNNLLRGGHFNMLLGGPMPGYYTGTTEAVPRLGVPSLKMQDAGNGFRPTDPGEAGSTTCWPSLLAMASTWDEDLVREVASAIGQEFKGKGANVILGPSINVHRSAYGGRNFEYFSGEDPHLGARLTKAYVEAVQRQGVMAVVKHFAFNEQETGRMTENSVVDERTAWELYYPPFQAAVEAGVGAFMCAYNRVNGPYACHNPDLLLKDLKGAMGFSGFVLSDWGASHGADAIEKGLDQEMPGVLVPGTTPAIDAIIDHFGDAALAATPERDAAANAAALRVLTSMYRLGLDEATSDGCVPPSCQQERASVQANGAHAAVARWAAAKATVLLKNSGVLPVDPGRVRKLAVLGPAAGTAQFYAGDGSGNVPLRNPTTPLAALRSRAAAAGVNVLDDPGSVGESDLAVLVAGTISSEGVDRTSLGLGDETDALISHIAQQVPTVVVLLTAGVVLTPWRDDVAAILTLFLGGEGSGEALADVLFGDSAPEGRLPAMFPATVADAIRPGGEGDVPYAEGLFTSYRSPTFKAAFPFGHGLSYAKFVYSPAEAMPEGDASCGAAAARCVRLTVSNIGPREGREVVQAYVQFDDALQMPRVLRSFSKTQLLVPGSSEVVTLNFMPRDLSVYIPGSGWTLQSKVVVHIGASSEDIRCSLGLM